MVIKVCIILGGEVLFFSALLFGAAGTVRWPGGWPALRLSVSGGCPVQSPLGRAFDPSLSMHRPRRLTLHHHAQNAVDAGLVALAMTL